ncbi:MAG: prenyltransferase/squalene oxidase repeat-containing protein, partial [Bryobacteraceae bacterium]
MKRLFIPAFVLLAAVAMRKDAEPIEKGAQYLWSHQAADGGWHSETYGLLKSGQSLTPFVLNALLQMPNPPAGQVDRALRFLQTHTDAQGAVGRMDALLSDYPNYATALSVQAICRARRPGWQRTIEPMLQYLRSQQFTEAHGWKREDAAYGAWGMGGVDLTPPNAGHVDISMTRHVLEAFAAADAKADDPALQRAAVFLDRCQNADGGFYFSTVVPDANKAGETAKGYRSYGTA